ncbi:triple tyrosine motif-containing protein, partial [Neolewinella agarilytica]|uniref:triple tyrosine motif-containing protein n=1 Tax=Neolewinella agarilytica TaxID=478744 RepID=UPI00235696DE
MMSNLPKTLANTLCMVLMMATLVAQNRIHTVHELSTRQGLTSNQYTNYVFKDSQGFVWASSVAGLNRFDGYRVRQYHAVPEDSTALVSEFASQSHIYEDQKKDIWFANKSCLIQYVREEDNFRRHHFSLPDGKLASELFLWAYLDDKSQEVYVSGNRHLFAMTIEEPIQKYLIDSIFVGLRDRMFTQDDGSQILFRQIEEEKILDVRVYRNHKRVSQDSVAVPIGSKIEDVWLVEGGYALMATTNGLYLLSIATRQYSKLPSNFLGKNITDIKSLASLGSNQWLVGTRTGNYYIYDLAGRQFASQMWSRSGAASSALTEESVTMTVDPDHNVWLCTEGQGIKYTNLRKPKFDAHFLQETADKKNFRALCEGGDGVVYGLLPKFVVKMTYQDTQYYSLPIESDYLNIPMEILVDSHSRVWVGTLSELFLLEPGVDSFEVVDLLPDNLTNRLPGYTFLKELSNGDLLIGPNQVGIFKISEDLKDSKWMDSTIDRTALWLEDESGSFLHTSYDDHLRLGRFTLNGLIVDTIISSFGFAPTGGFDAKRNQYWLGTSNGLWTVRKVLNQWIIEQDSIIGDGYIISSIKLEESENIWFSSSGGLCNYHIDSGVLSTYSEADGIASRDFSYDAFLEHTDGRMIFGSPNGLTTFLPSLVNPSVAEARPTITGIKINDQIDLFSNFNTGNFANPSLVTELKLPYYLNSVDIDISAMEYSDPSACQYQFQMLGANNIEKRPITNEPKVSFTNLGEGDYVLNIWAWNSDGVRSEKPRVLKLSILPPWYRTWWAYIIYGMLIAAAGWGVNWYRLRNIREIEKEQLRTAQAEAIAAETETSVLRLQMNPHFIFNSLNSINSFIMTG